MSEETETDLTSSEYTDLGSEISPTSAEKDNKLTTQIITAGAIFVFLIAAAALGLLLLLSPGTEVLDSTSAGGAPESAGPPSTPALLISTKTANTTRTTNTTTTTHTTTTNTAKTTITPKPRTKTMTTTATTAKSTTTTTEPQWTLPNKTILCTFGAHVKTSAVAPKEGLCDLIFWDFFYKSGRGSFLNRSSVGLQWFLEFARNDSGTTQFGIGIDHGNAQEAFDDLNNAVGMSTFSDFWKWNIRHYGLLKFQVHDDFVTNRSTVLGYDKLLKRLRDLQEVNRAGDVKIFGYIILGVGLFAPRNSTVYDYLEELLRTAPIDAIIIRTHREDDFSGKTCKITGPNVYLRSWNVYETSMVEALDYVQSRQAQFSRRLLMVSFSMAAVWSWPRRTKDKAQFYQPGESCTFIRLYSMYGMCIHNTRFRGTVVPDSYVMLGYTLTSGNSVAYDSPNTINTKICLSTKRYPGLQLGVALFALELEDGNNGCLKKGYLNEVAGYWRTSGVSSYIKNVTRDPNFFTKDPPCS